MLPLTPQDLGTTPTHLPQFAMPAPTSGSEHAVPEDDPMQIDQGETSEQLWTPPVSTWTHNTRSRGRNVLRNFLVQRETHGRIRSRQNTLMSREFVANRLPYMLKEKELPCENAFDKVFASAWIDSSRVAIGSKDNKLVVWHVDRNISQLVTLPTGRNAEQRDQQCGIHSIALNRSRTLLATGAKNPNDMAVFTLPSFQPVAVLEGHKDWIFASVWLSETILCTASRDRTVKLWMMSQRSKGKLLISREEHDNKVRDLSFNLDTMQLASLSADSYLKLWDTRSFDVISSVRLFHQNDLVCVSLCQEQNLYAVGSQRHIMFVDPRTASVVQVVPSLDEGFGVRSLSFNSNILTVGGGVGRISFYDMRGMYLPVADDRPYLTVGPGWLRRDAIYEAHFMGMQFPNAVYTHCYDPTRSRLFAAGGPLPFGLGGSYAAVWQ
eukprot:GFYU01017268.1.p1 GENE.GFYU01017268.1~~GFYU01017268.1.p1  ORF type:complete len:437 (-),score=-14.21 GFYU01017268.1:70-1380(-)